MRIVLYYPFENQNENIFEWGQRNHSIVFETERDI